MYAKKDERYNQKPGKIFRSIENDLIQILKQHKHDIKTNCKKIE